MTVTKIGNEYFVINFETGAVVEGPFRTQSEAVAAIARLNRQN